MFKTGARWRQHQGAYLFHTLPACQAAAHPTTRRSCAADAGGPVEKASDRRRKGNSPPALALLAEAATQPAPPQATSAASSSSASSSRSSFEGAHSGGAGSAGDAAQATSSFATGAPKPCAAKGGTNVAHKHLQLTLIELSGECASAQCCQQPTHRQTTCQHANLMEFCGETVLMFACPPAAAGHLLATFGGFMSSPFAAIASQPMANGQDGSVSGHSTDADKRSAGRRPSTLGARQDSPMR